MSKATKSNTKEKPFNVTTTRNVGSNKGFPRIWLEGNKLDTCGFTCGERFNIKTNKQTLVLTLCEDGEKLVTGSQVTDDYRKPIIDINNLSLVDFLDGAEQVDVNYQVGVITVKRIKPV